jgi:zinc protease
LTGNSASIYIKFPAKFNKTNQNTEEAVRYDFVNEYISRMLNTRLSEARQNPDAKFMGAYTMIGKLADNIDMFYLSASTKNNELIAGFDEVLTILEQARRFGFSASELERSKADLIQYYESNYAERNDKKHNNYNNAAYGNFQYNAPMMNEEQELNLAKKLNATIKVDELNKWLKEIVVFGPNTIIYASGPDKADVTLPNDETLMITMYGVAKKDLKPYEDAVSDKPLISKEIKAGKVTKETQNKVLGATEWTLSNGMKIVLKPTTFKQDEISFSGSSEGGFSLLSDADWAATRGMMSIRNGVGEFDGVALGKMLAGKKADADPSIYDLSQGMSGSSSPKDLETALQLVYLHFTAPRFEQKDFDLTIGRWKNSIANQASDPNSALSDTLNNLLTNYNPRAKSLTEADLAKLDLNKMREVYKQRFANPGAFTFVFVGNIDLKTAKPLIEKYLGGLTGNKKETYKDPNKYPIKGEVKNHFKRSMETAKASVNIIYSGDMAYTQENVIAMDYLSRVLRLRYTEEIREKRGGTYGAGVRGGVYDEPKQRFTLGILFDTDPKMMDELIGVAHDELKKIAENGVLADDFNKSAGNMKSQFDQQQIENGYWHGILNSYYLDGMDLHTNWKKTYDKVDSKVIQNLAQQILKQKNCIEVVMLPE